MTALLLVAVAAFFIELSSTIGKEELAHKKESFYAVAFLSGIWATLIFISVTLLTADAFVFSLQSLPTFLIRAVLEIALVFTSIQALKEADRSTFTFLRMLTLPLLLVVDLFLGYSLTQLELLGILLLIITPLFLATEHSMSAHGKVLALLSATIAAATISLYKYNITHFNSIAAEQVIMHSIILTVIIATAWFRGHENVFRYLTKPICLAQSLAAGVAAVCMSFAYAIGVASVVIAMKRAFELIWSLVLGRLYFHESRMAMKLIALSLALTGIYLIVA